MHSLRRYRGLTLLLAILLVVNLLGCSGSGSNAKPETRGKSARSAQPVSPAQSRLLGDLDGDGEPSVGDAIKILRIVVGLDPDDECADANENGSTDVGDAIKVLRCVVGLDDWPIGECGGGIPSGAVWFERFDRAIIGQIAFDALGIGKCLSDMIFPSPISSEWMFVRQGQDSGAEITAGRALKLWARTTEQGNGLEAVPHCCRTDLQPIALTRDLKMGFDVDSSGVWPPSGFKIGGFAIHLVVGTAEIYYVFAHDSSFLRYREATKINLGDSGHFTRDLWSDFTLANGGEPTGMSVDFLEVFIEGDASETATDGVVATLDNMWFGRQ